jgi:hypothetical protein
VKADLEAVQRQVEPLQALQDILDPTTGVVTTRRHRFDELGKKLGASSNLIDQHIARTMKSFRPGLFVGGDDLELPVDNLDLERAFRLPKGHERRIHGHAHAGVRIVYRGATLLPVLDAHAKHPDCFTAEDLIPWVNARSPEGQRDCERRRAIMRRARSSKNRPLLLADLERRYHAAIRPP